MMKPMTESVRKFIVDSVIDYPSADISFNWRSSANGTLKLRMHFSRVVDGAARDLELIFKEPIAVQWEAESFGLIDSLEEIPKCGSTKFSYWSYPILMIENSKWADKYASNLYSVEKWETHNVVHYFFISMNDLVHVLSAKPPTSKWVDSIYD